jgi:2-iminobutanoate/2-iminopropanoate deaminase
MADDVRTRVALQIADAPAQPPFISHAVRLGDLVFTSGAAPRDPVSREIPQGFEAQARLVFANLEAVLGGSGSSLRRALKVTVFLADIEDWAVMNDIYCQYIDLGDAPARTTVEVSAMNNGYLIEAEAIAVAER